MANDRQSATARTARPSRRSLAGRRVPRDGLPGRQRLPPVSPDVRRAVEAAIGELGYVPNRAARSLVTRRSDSIGVVITEPAGRLFSDPFFPRLLRGISARARRPRPAARPPHARRRRPRRSAPRTTSPPATSTARCSSASTATTRSRPGWPRRASRWSSRRAAAARPMSLSYVDVDNRRWRAQRRRRTSSVEGAGVDRDDRRARPTWRPASTASPGYRDALARPASSADPSLEAVGDFTQDGGAAAMAAAARPRARHRRRVRRVRPHGRRRARRPRPRPADASRRTSRVVGFDDSPVATTTQPTADQRPSADRGDGPRDGPPAARRHRGPDRVPRRVILATEARSERASSAGRRKP